MIWRAIVAASLAGCTSLTTNVEPVEVPVPVVETCIALKDLPPPPTNSMSPGANVERLAAGASADLRALQLYANKLNALLRACAEEK